MAMKQLVVVTAALVVMGCAPPPAPHVPSLRLASTSGEIEEFPTDLSDTSWTVLVFFAADCPCFRAHEGRLHALQQTYASRGIRFLLVDSEVDASQARDVQVSRERALAIPLVIDSKALLADALAAEYATYSVVLDAQGAVHYRGGIDSDKSHLRPDATFYLRDALDDLLAGDEPRRAEAKTLGCPLQTR